MEVVVISGISVGAMYALIALGMSLEYRYSKIVNLAHGTQVLLGAYLFNVLRGDVGRPLALVAGLGGAALSSLVLEYITVERLRGAPLMIRTMATLAVLMIILGSCLLLFGTKIRTTQVLFTSATFDVLGVRVAGDTIILILVSAGSALGLALFFRRSAVGIQMRAAGDRALLAQTIGIDSVKLGRLIWLAGGVLAGLAGILVMPLIQLDPIVYMSIGILAYAVLLVARMESIPIVFAAGLGLGVLQRATSYWFPQIFGLPDVVTFAVVLAALLVGSERLQWAEIEEAV